MEQFVKITLEDYTTLVKANVALAKDYEHEKESRWLTEAKNRELTTALASAEEENKKLVNELAALEIELANYTEVCK